MRRFDDKMKDRISELPDEILSYILTMLSIKDLLKTSVLSKRWCKLWTLRRDLYFNVVNVLGSEKELLENGHLIVIGDVYRCLILDTCRDEFTKRVDQFVKSFKDTKIDSFAVNFKLDCEQSSIVNQWISFAVTRRVGRIDLLFLGRPYYAYGDKCFSFTTDQGNHFRLDFGLFLETNVSSLNHLRIENCLVCNPTNSDFSPFKNLRYLSLEDSKLDEILIESLLSNCPRLEELYLLFCEFKSSMPKIVSSSLCHLKVPGCYFVYNNLYQVEVNLILLDCLKLISLELDFNDVSLEDSLDTLTFNTPTLKSIEFSISSKEELNTFVALCATFFPQLEIMHVNVFCMVIPFVNLTQPLKHLKQLNLIIYIDDVEFDLLWILSIFQVCPLLQKLSVMFRHPKFSKKQKDIRDVEVFSHGEVKVIELRGCVGNWYEIEFIINVLKYAHTLEQIVVSPYWGEGDSSNSKSNPVWFQSGRERMSEKLRGEAVERGKLVFL